MYIKWCLPQKDQGTDVRSACSFAESKLLSRNKTKKFLSQPSKFCEEQNKAFIRTFVTGKQLFLYFGL